MNHVLVIASIVTAVGFIGCALAALPARWWTIRVHYAAIALAAATSVLDFLAHGWLRGATFAILTASAVFTLLAKRNILDLRKITARRWDA